MRLVDIHQLLGFARFWASRWSSQDPAGRLELEAIEERIRPRDELVRKFPGLEQRELGPRSKYEHGHGENGHAKDLLKRPIFFRQREHL